MGGLWTRLLAAAVAAVVAAAVGGALSGTWGGGAAGAALGLALLWLVDAWRGAQLLRWLRGAAQGAAPLNGGWWGELAYRMAAALRASERQIVVERRRLEDFLSAIEASPNGVLLLDAADQITWCNAAAADQFGIDAQRDLAQPVTNLVRAPAFVAYLHAQRSGGAVEPLVLDDLGRGATLQMTLRAYGGRQLLLITQDITERQRAETMRRDFVANVSHEIRTPLTVLAGFVESMQSLPLEGQERDRVLALMQQQTKRMQTLVADLLTLAQLEGSPRPPVDRWVALHKIVEQALADGRALSAGRHVLRAEDMLVVELAGNEAELFSALMNLVSNAVRYSPEGGDIVLGWHSGSDGRGAVTVRDQGMGIAREHLPRLTERFYRVDGGRSRASGGTGLGLAIVKHVLQRHGGELAIDSERGRGSCFQLQFPPGRVRVRDAQAPKPAPAVSAE